MNPRHDPRNDELADRLHSAAIHLIRSLRHVDAASGLTSPRLSVLSVLVFGGPRTLGELAQVEQVKPPTMTRLVAALEEARLVRREIDRSDRRVTRIHATAQGSRVMRAGRKRRVNDLASRVSKMTATEVRQLQDAVELVARLARS